MTPFPSLLTTLTNPAPYHLLLYSTLLGASLFQTFVNTKITFLALPRSAFRSLQKRIFPLYFRSQTALVVLCALTVPPHGVFTLVKNRVDWVAFVVAGVTAGVNLVVFEPRTRGVMGECVHQETRDARLNAEGKGSGEEPSAEMKHLRKAFSRNHAMCIHLNLISIGAMVVYGWRLALRLAVDCV